MYIFNFISLSFKFNLIYKILESCYYYIFKQFLNNQDKIDETNLY